MDDATLNDIQQFEDFFSRMGVPYERNFGINDEYWLSRNKSEEWLSVSQVHFQFFDRRFVGVKSDETDHFQPRVETP